ncbi:hypothetical protein BZY71_21770 [Leclercia adecarboxylata]|nr:hypothetical protein BZY71_21770 [Leclercia adecarboxylata]
MVTISPSVPVPLRVGVVSRVLPPEVSGSSPLPSGLTVIAGTPGVAGARVSTTRLKLSEVETLPTASLTDAVRTWVPLTSGVASCRLQIPSALLVVVPSRVVPS